jgi:hypothetical protein
MSTRPSKKELAKVAEGHFLAGFGESLEAQEALAWLGRNLFERAGLPADIVCNELKELAPELSLERLESIDRSMRKGFEASKRLLFEVWESTAGDPTKGAVRAHRHNEAPRWAELLWPTALIGPWIFYRSGL